MNICMFAKGLPVHVVGGLELHVQELTKGLVERGHKVTIITTKHPKGVKKEKEENLKIFYVGDKPLKFTKKFYIESSKLFNKLDKQENFNIIHSQSSSGSGFVKYSKSKKPFLITMHGTFRNEVRSMINERNMKILYMIPYMYSMYFLFHNPMDRFSFKRAKKIIAGSKELKKDLIKEYGIPEKKIVIVHDGIDVNKFKPFDANKFRKKLGISKRERVIVSSGRIGKQKGYHLIIEILPELLKHFDTKLIIVGTGDYIENLKKLANKTGVSDKVIFVGKATDENMVKYYNLADIFVFPTLRIEAFGIVVAEAMACGKPVITTRIGGIPTVVDDNENGFLIQMGNKEELKNKILMLLRDDIMAKRIGKAAREKVVKNFSMEKMTEDTIKFYEEVLNENGRKSL